MRLNSSVPVDIATQRVSGRLSRRAALGGALAGGLGAMLPRPALAQRLTASEAAWGQFQERFVSGGRVIDTGNGGMSHSEGQGTALLAAARTGDRVRFEQIYGWTRATLCRPYDRLHAWRYVPSAVTPVSDMNNATDGDLLIAWALFTAARRWDHQPYRTAAMGVTRDIAHALVTSTPSGAMLLPGITGFQDAAGLTVNPSYYVFPALRQLASEMPDPVWGRVWNDGLAMLRNARFGRWDLPPDWLVVPNAGPSQISGKWPPRFSFDAVRVPLYMCWSGLERHPVVDAVAAFWASQGPHAAPAWANLRTAELAPYAQSTGMTAIRRYVDDSRSRSGRPLSVPSISGARDYYAAALTLLVQLAADDGAAPVATS